MSFTNIECDSIVCTSNLESTLINTGSIVIKNTSTFSNIVESSNIYVNNTVNVSGNLNITKNTFLNSTLIQKSLSNDPSTEITSVFYKKNNDLFFKYNDSKINLTTIETNDVIFNELDTTKLIPITTKYVNVFNNNKYILNSAPREVHLNNYLQNKQLYPSVKPTNGTSLNIKTNSSVYPFIVVGGTGFTLIEPYINNGYENFFYVNSSIIKGAWYSDKKIFSAYYFPAADTTVTNTIFDNTKKISVTTNVSKIQADARGTMSVILNTSGDIETYLFDNTWSMVRKLEGQNYTDILLCKDTTFLIAITSSKLDIFKRSSSGSVLNWKKTTSVNLSIQHIEETIIDTNSLHVMENGSITEYYRNGDFFSGPHKTISLVSGVAHTFSTHNRYLAVSNKTSPTGEIDIYFDYEKIQKIKIGASIDKIIMKTDGFICSTNNFIHMYKKNRVWEKYATYKIPDGVTILDMYLSLHSEFIYIITSDYMAVLYPVTVNKQFVISEFRRFTHGGTTANRSVSVSEYNQVTHLALDNVVYLSGF
tara:strand:- start:526 stop:2130 length:1605 start_codon:yes stop_codon:yes gene_type:complete